MTISPGRPPKPIDAVSGTGTLGGMDVATQGGHGVLIDAIYWEHYAERIEAMDLPNLDEGNFFAGAVSVLVSTGVALIGVIFGTDNPSPILLTVLGAMLLASAVATYYFRRKYDAAKTGLKKTGGQLAKEMRKVASEQQRRLEDEKRAGGGRPA